MAISPRLHRKLQETLGAEATSDLMGVLETVDSSRTEVRELRHEMQLSFARLDERLSERFARVDERLAGVRGELTTALEKGLREQTRFFFVAWAVILASIVGIYVRR
jgi:hypothetical protein